VAKNIQKAVDAAGTQIAAIQRLRGSRAWDKLSSSLRETAELRLQNEDATLSELALLHQPPITKSGLNHRLKKLLEMAEQDNETTDG
jgi:DNA-binding protein WhiA